MRILASHKVSGMVPYEHAAEIPAACVMELVNGPNLYDAVRNRYCDDWETVLDIAVQLAQIIRRAHLLPERVLHRDIRPPNIMLQDYYANPDSLHVVVLDFDLSWHLGADELSVTNTSTMGGYLAPEQVTKMPNVSTRSAAVDSFGFGMTLYYLSTATEPIFLQHLHKDWQDELFRKVRERPCSRWECVPARIARLILNATRHEQSARWGFGQIEGELELLSEAALSPEMVRSAELMAEELAARTIRIGGHRPYEWDADSLTARIALASGVSASITAAEVARKVRIRLEWSKDVGTAHKNVRKYLVAHIDQAVSRMRDLGWQVLPETEMSSQFARVAFEMPTSQLRGGLHNTAGVFAECLKLFEF